MAIRRFSPPPHLEIVFAISTAIIFFASLGEYFWCLSALAIGTVSFLAMSLLEVRCAEDLPPTLQLQSMGVLGFLYCGLFPGLAVRFLLQYQQNQQDRGAIWLFGLMAIVFTGDTLAYIFGRAIGRHKLLEAVSPKKTIEGAIGGLIGSALAGAVLGIFFLPDRPLWAIVLTALTTGAFAQVGDLFESLLKRVAEVKDSGTMMPGHGGILDRVDGLLFAAPVYYVLARFLVL
jgi:phosphatidate cytidylyltransferase